MLVRHVLAAPHSISAVLSLSVCPSYNIYKRLPVVQLILHQGMGILLARALAQTLTLLDLRSLRACCRYFKAFVDALPQNHWEVVARCDCLECIATAA